MAVVRANRAAGIAHHNGSVLLHRAEHEDFWTLPGGSIEDLERAELALIREMREEMNAEVVPGRLMVVIENFLLYNGVTYHEIGLYFAMSFRPDSPLYTLPTFDGVEQYFNNSDPFRLIFEWIPLESLAEMDVRPAILKQVLAQPDASSSPLHLIRDDTGLSR